MTSPCENPNLIKPLKKIRNKNIGLGSAQTESYRKLKISGTPKLKGRIRSNLNFKVMLYVKEATNEIRLNFWSFFGNLDGNF